MVQSVFVASSVIVIWRVIPVANVVSCDPEQLLWDVFVFSIIIHYFDVFKW